MSRRVPAVLLTGVALAAAGTVAAAASGPTDDTPPAATTETVTLAPAPLMVADLGYEGHTARWWARRARGWHQRATGLRRTLLHRGSVTEAINLACAVYGSCRTLWRRAGCETGGTFDPAAHNPSGASGLFQFKPGTFASTPFARLSIWSPYASALAAGWMIVAGRGGEWACR